MRHVTKMLWHMYILDVVDWRLLVDCKMVVPIVIRWHNTSKQINLNWTGLFIKTHSNGSVLCDQSALTHVHTWCSGLKIISRLQDGSTYIVIKWYNSSKQINLNWTGLFYDKQCVMWPKKPVCHTMNILTGRNKT